MRLHWPGTLTRIKRLARYCRWDTCEEAANEFRNGTAKRKIQPRMISYRAAAFAVFIAFSSGLLASLALRPAGQSPAPTRLPSVGAQAAVHKWRLPGAFQTTMPVLGDNILYVADALNRSSGGRFAVSVFEPGELVPAFSITDAVREGKVKAGFTWLGYDQGKIPASALLGAVPFGMEPWEFAAWWYEDGGQDLARALYRDYNIYPLFCGITGPETAGWFRFPIEDLQDFKGLKIRFAGLGGKVIARLGASVTMLPGGEIFQALEKGAIDATEFALPVVDQALGFDRVAPFNYFPGWHQPATGFHLVVNLKVWEALSPSDQALLETACTAGVTRNLARSEALQGPVLESFAERGVSALSLPEPILHQLREVTETLLNEEAAQDEWFARILAAQRTFRAQHRHWKERAYLPRDF